jgi:hypothetical protein
LENELRYYKSSSGRSLSDIHSASGHGHDSSEGERDQLHRLVIDLKHKLSESEKEKAIIVAAHNEEILELRAEADAQQEVILRLYRNLSFTKL